MRKLATILVVAAMVGILAGTVMAAEGDKPKRKRPPGRVGKIVKVEGTNVTIATRAKKGEKPTEVVVATDENTTVRIDRKEAKLADLKAGMFVFITPEEGTAKAIRARTGRPRRRPGGGDRPRRKKPE